MKRLLVLSVCCALGGCVCVPCLDLRPAPTVVVAVAGAAAPAVPPGDMRVAFDGVEIERIPFRTGVSSATVERLARSASCTGGMGAGLITAPGPVEVYRMACDNGKVFLARCELRQCKPM
jgi:hypothetical protein